jgi:imidazolonepropionase-like amidohydrolase
MLAITGATIIDGNGGTPIRDGVIVIQDGRIVRLGDRSTSVPVHARRISADEKYVIPGLLDANVHLLIDFFSGPHTLLRYAGRYADLIIESAQVALKAGVTTVFDTHGPRADLVRARHAINSGAVTGSRIYLAGNIVGLGGPFSSDMAGLFGGGDLPESITSKINASWEENVGPDLLWMSPEQVRQEIRDYVQKEIDFLKFALTTHTSRMQHLMFSPRITRVIIEEARRAGLTVQTHTTTNEGLHLAIESGVDLMQHVDLNFGPCPIPGETIELMAERRVPAAILPQTAKALSWCRENAWKTPSLEHYETMDRNVRALLNANVVLLLSTDAGVYSADTLGSSRRKTYVPPEEGLRQLGEGHFNWLLAVEQKGMKPMDALMAATRNIARAYKVDRDIGTLEEGKLADLVILDRNPLESAANYRAISLVMKEGVIVDREVLPNPKLLTHDETAGPEARRTSAPSDARVNCCS